MSKAKNDAIVIRSYSDLIDLKPIEELEIDVTAKLTPSLVHKLEKIIVSAVSSKFQMLNIEKQSMIDTIVAQEKKAVGVKNFTQKVKNLENKSTVIRWCAAFALTEIAKYNSKKQKELVAKFQKLLEKEQNNGVKNVYIKALKKIKKP